MSWRDASPGRYYSEDDRKNYYSIHYRTTVCKYAIKGCAYKNCKFAHSLDEFRISAIKKCPSRKCTDAECKMIHLCQKQKIFDKAWFGVFGTLPCDERSPRERSRDERSPRDEIKEHVYTPQPPHAPQPPHPPHAPQPIPDPVHTQQFFDHKDVRIVNLEARVLYMEYVLSTMRIPVFS